MCQLSVQPVVLRLRYFYMAQELSGVTVVIFIACGILTLILLFIFAKRQIMRFALRSRRGPHVPIGHGAKSSLKKEIDHYIEIIPRIVYEPLLLEDSKCASPNICNSSHYYRLRAVSEIKILEKKIAKQGANLKRHPNDNFRSFLISALGAPMNGCEQKLIHQFCDLYEHARYDPSEFGEEEYQIFNRLLLKLLDITNLIRSYPNSKRNSPNRTPLKKSITTDLRLHPDAKFEEELQKITGKENSIQNLRTSYEGSETSV